MKFVTRNGYLGDNPVLTFTHRSRSLRIEYIMAEGKDQNRVMEEILLEFDLLHIDEDKKKDNNRINSDR